LDTIEECSIVGAFGGFTTIIHYVYAKPGQKLADSIKKAIYEGKATSHTDFSIHGTLFDAKNQMKEIASCFEMGVKSFKMFMAYGRRGLMTDDYYLAKTMDAIAHVGGLVLIHAENGLAIDYLEDKYRGSYKKAIYSKTRPALLEADAVFRAISIAEVMGCPIYIVHVSCKDSVDIVRRAKERGQSVYAETCPQYLCLTEREVPKKGSLAKIAPPLRKREDCEALWEGLSLGIIDVIASDHAPVSKGADDDFFEAPFGSPSLETMLTVTYQRGVNEGRVNIHTLVKAMSETPAKIFGLFPQKGILQEGSDADLVVFDPLQRNTIATSSQHSNAPYTLYEGFKCLGRAILVMQRGETIVKNAELMSTTGRACFLPTTN
jgi:dihydropyrimidinase